MTATTIDPETGKPYRYPPEWKYAWRKGPQPSFEALVAAWRVIIRHRINQALDAQNVMGESNER